MTTKKKSNKSAKSFPTVVPVQKGLLSEVRLLIESTRSNVAKIVNSELTTLYWKIGTKIRKEILQNKRAQYGEEIVMALSLELTSEYGRGFDVKNLRHMIRFAEVFSNHKIVYALRRQLGWTHFRSIIYIDDPLKRNFYAEMCRIEHWSTRKEQCYLVSLKKLLSMKLQIYAGKTNYPQI